MRKWLILLGYAVILIFGLINRDLIISWIQNSETENLPIMLFLSVLLATIPIIPFTLFSGLMGAKYGAMLGSVINWFGGVSAAVIYFILSRYFFRNYFCTYMKNVKGIEKFQNTIEKNAFIAILYSRMIPIIPPPVVNIYSGVSNISLGTFLAATSIGKIPPVFMVAFIGEQMFSSLYNLSIGIFIYVIFLFSIHRIYKVWLTRKSKLS
jgi:uncharacterized membrane protein YdjX (TVP38/TMEM64 family)